MAIATKYKIKFTCGHSETKDLASTPAGKRAGKATWLGKNFTCVKCFKAKGQAELEKDAAEVLAEAEIFEEENNLPELEGSEKQIRWATRVRYLALASGIEHLGETSQEAEEVRKAAQTIIRAGWWIDYKDMEAEEVYEVVTTGAVAAAEKARNDVVTENPY